MALLAGRYRLCETLGRGGMGWVQRAEELQAGRQVAIKFLQPDEDSERLVTEFWWEVQAIARLDHPGVVRILDFGITEEKPYIVMALSGGTQLNQVSTTAITWPCFCTIAEQLLTVLAHAHARGVYHHDLKPGNILIHADPSGYVRVEVIDFGIAGVVGHQVSGHGHAPSELVGTASYLAPESVHSYSAYRFNPAPDIYGIGIMAYELAYGRLPFSGTEPREILRQHQRTAPPRLPFREGFAAPKELHQFIHSLVAKNPRNRPGSALEVLQRLRTIAPAKTLGGGLRAPGVPRLRFGLDQDVAGQEQNDRPVDPTKMLAVRPPLFSGRHRIRSYMQEKLAESTLETKSNVLLLYGASGVGKTRLVREVAYQVAEQGLAAVSLVPYSLSRSNSVEGWRAGLLSALGYAGSTRKHFLRQIDRDLKWLGLKNELEPSIVAELFFPSEQGTETEQLDPDQADWVGTYLKLLVALCRRQPQLLILEDYCGTDDGRGFQLLETFARLKESCPLLVVLTMSVEAHQDAVVLKPELKRLTHLPQFWQQRLEPLSGPSMKRLLDGLLPLDASLRERVVKASFGLPIYSVEILRFWVEATALEPAQYGYRLSNEVRSLPPSVSDIWKARLDLVSASNQGLSHHVELLLRAAVLGEPFSHGTLREVAECEQRADLVGNFNKIWSDLHSKGLWEQIAPGQAVFVHDTLRMAALARLGAPQIRALHQLCGTARLRSPSSGGGEVLRVARHYEQAGLPNEAFPFFMRACRKAFREGRYQASLSHCHSAARLLMAAETGSSQYDRRWAQVDRLLAETLMQLARYDDVEEVARRLEDRAKQWNDLHFKATALRLSANARRCKGLAEQAEPLLKEALQIFQHLGLKRELGYTELELGRLWLDRRAPGEVIGHLQAARQHMQAIQDERGAAQAMLSEAILVAGVGKLAYAIQLLEHADVIFVELSDRPGRADVLRHRASIDVAQGALERAIERLGEAGTRYRMINNHEGLSLCLLETGRIQLLSRRTARAEKCFRRGREQFQALNNRPYALLAFLYLLEAAVYNRQFASTKEHLEQLLPELRRWVGDRYLVTALVLLARCYAEQKLWPETDDSLYQAVRILERLDLADVRLAPHFEPIAQLAVKAGQTVIAETALNRALTMWAKLNRVEDVSRINAFISSLS